MAIPRQKQILSLAVLLDQLPLAFVWAKWTPVRRQKPGAQELLQVTSPFDDDHPDLDPI
jgi:hypothetical protein